MTNFTPRASALLIKDAQNRTKALPETLKSELTYIAGWCYWFKASALMKEFAYQCLELLNKDVLRQILKHLELTTPKSASKEEMVAVLKRVKITELRSHLLAEVLPKFELSVVTFEQLFRISKANRRRLQEIEGALPIIRWDSYKYGDYPVLSLFGTLQILHADKELLEQFTTYVKSKLTEAAKKAEAEKAIELSFKDKFYELVETEKDILQNRDVQIWLKHQQFKSAYRLVKSLIDNKKQFNELQEHYMQLCSRLGEKQISFSSLPQLQAAVGKLHEKAYQIEKNQREEAEMINYAQELDNLMQNNEDFELFTKISNTKFRFSTIVQNNSKALKFCQRILIQHRKATLGQKSWKNQKHVMETIADLEDLIYAHPVLLKIQQVEDIEL